MPDAPESRNDYGLQYPSGETVFRFPGPSLLTEIARNGVDAARFQGKPPVPVRRLVTVTYGEWEPVPQADLDAMADDAVKS